MRVPPQTSCLVLNPARLQSKQGNRNLTMPRSTGNHSVIQNAARMSAWRLAAWAGVAAAAPALAAGPTIKEPKLVRRDGVWHVGQEDRWSWDAQPTPSRGPSLRGPPDSAVDSHWVSAVSGNWEDAVRWSTSPATPNNGGGTTYNVFLDAVGAAYTVGLSTAATVDQLSMPTASALLNIGAGGVLSVAGEATLGGGKIRLDGGQIVGGTYTMSGGLSGLRRIRRI